MTELCGGGNPSRSPCSTSSPTKVPANAPCAATANMSHHLRVHANSADLLSNLGALRAFAWASFGMRSIHSSPQRPPTSHGSTMNFNKPRSVALTSSGYVSPLFSRIFCILIPGTLAVRGWGVPSQCSGLHMVVSKINGTPWKHGRPYAAISTFRLSDAATPRRMSASLLFGLTLAPASLQILANMRSKTVALLRTLPVFMHDARWSPCASSLLRAPCASLQPSAGHTCSSI